MSGYININTWPDTKNMKRRQMFVKFENKWSVSIVYGTGIYSSMTGGSAFTPDYPDDTHAETVEIAIYDPNDEMVPFASSNDSVKGYVKPDMMIDILAWVKNQPKDKT